MAKGRSAERLLLNLRHYPPMVDRLAQGFLEAFDGCGGVKTFSFHATMEAATVVMSCWGGPSMTRPTQC
ncbi:MAG: hypothetical protein M1813_006614 [Trichoglossum hirsutum]|nr:MAG: hypothetical protein M1813_006614 [Trichoglossum hirsutum]